MAKSILTLYLNYKGKDLDVIKHGRHFTNKWFIGSNKFLQWQILDPSFPDKHLLLSQKGDTLFLNLVNPNQLACSQNGKEVDNAQLKSSGLLRGRELELRNNLSGTINLTPDWQIRFTYTEPWVRVLTHEEQQIVAQYSRHPEGTAVERFNRNVLILALIVCGLFLVAYDLFLKPVSSTAGTLEATLARLQTNAERVQLPENIPESTGMSDAERAAAEAAARDAAARQAAADAAAQAAANRVATGTTRTTPGGTGRTAASVFGENFAQTGTPGGTRTKTVVATVGRQITGASRGGTGGSGGTGPGPGGGPGTGVGNPGNWDPSRIVQPNSQNIVGGIVQGAGNVRGGTTAPSGGDVVMATGGNISELAPPGRPIAQSSTDRGRISTYADIPPKKEADIQGLSEQERPDLETVASSVRTRQRSVEQLYRRAAAIKAASGSVKIRLYISANGRVEAAQITPTTAGFTDEFLKDLENMIKSWTFPIKSKQVYEFTYRLSQ